MKLKFFDVAKKLSLKSTHRDYKIGGVLVKKSRILSVGYNQMKSHTKSNHPYSTIHCELDVIIGVSKEDLVGSDLYLYREHKNGLPATSKPCEYCMKLIKHAGIKRIHFTSSEENYITLMVKDA